MRAIRFLSVPLTLWILGVCPGATVIEVPEEWPTIQEGIHAATDGDTVLVSAGTYYENIRFHGKRILLTSYLHGPWAHRLREEVILDGSYPTDPESSAVVYFVDGEDSTSVLRGFTIRNGAGQLNGGRRTGGGIFCDFGSPTIEGNLIMGNSAHCGGAIHYKDSTEQRMHIIGNEICWNAAACFGGGIWIPGSFGHEGSNVLIEDNVIHGNTASTVERNLIAANTGAGVIIADYDPGSELVLLNNTICGNTKAIDIWYALAVEIRNNIIADNGVGIELRAVGTHSISYNDVWSNADGDYVGCQAGFGDISDNPLFVGGVPFDYHLTGDSPCIDAGDPESPPDPDSTRADIGAFYFDQGTSGVTEAWPAFAPEEITLSVWPNPCSGRACVSMALSSGREHVVLGIYDLGGRLLKRLHSGAAAPGRIDFSWDGLTGSGRPVPEGVYFLRVEASGRHENQRLVLVK
jgi:hypothetical protein